MSFTTADLKKIWGEARKHQVPPIQPNGDCDQEHYKLYHDGTRWIAVGDGGIEIARGDDGEDSQSPPVR